MTMTLGQPFDPSPFAMNRRAFLGRYAGAIGTLALSCLLEEEQIAPAGPAACRGRGQVGHLPVPARRAEPDGPVRPQAALAKYHGKPYPASWRSTSTSRRATCWRRRSSSGRTASRAWCSSELVPHTAEIADDLTLVRSMTTESVDHESALRLIHTGKFLAGRPTWGSWVVYGLGTENRNLPAYVVLSDPGGLPVDGVRNWSSGWLPAVYQGTPFRSGDRPVLNLKTPPGVTPGARAASSGSSTS